jgi:hypothetical protein
MEMDIVTQYSLKYLLKETFLRIMEAGVYGLDFGASSKI